MQQQELRDTLLYSPKNGYDVLSQEELEQMNAYCEGYKTFLNAGKTERECVRAAIAMAEKFGYRPWQAGETLQAGDKVYYNNRGRAIMLAHVGTESLNAGTTIVVAHTDAPALHLKPTPLFEEDEMAFFKTHYYGGIIKYQWLATPLVLHGEVVLKDGSHVTVSVGDGEDDPQFIITDLLPHLGKERGKQPLYEGVAGEKLHILVGSRPLSGDDGKNRVKVEVLRLLHDRYGITEEDLISAELQAVPAAMARDMGFDRSFIGAYGHDDRVCAYAGLAALTELKAPKKTALCVFADKEEIGSEGVSGMQSAAFDYFLGDLCKATGADFNTCCANSFCLSADVTTAYDPNFSEVYDKHNACRVNYGLGLKKYTGHGGKSGASDASAETVALVRNLLNKHHVLWQNSQSGKVDAGGGGTVAKYMAKRNIDTLDAGVPVLSMHAPCEVVSKLDCYMAYRAMKVLFEQ
ncbi:MAG: aminopeptidase [Oscillospiraceae bacterium]|nr:aminopeptidase [Oscillospiraceae bacterium]